MQSRRQRRSSIVDAHSRLQEMHHEATPAGAAAPAGDAQPVAAPRRRAYKRYTKAESAVDWLTLAFHDARLEHIYRGYLLARATRLTKVASAAFLACLVAFGLCEYFAGFSGYGASGAGASMAVAIAVARGMTGLIPALFILFARSVAHSDAFSKSLSCGLSPVAIREYTMAAVYTMHGLMLVSTAAIGVAGGATLYYPFAWWQTTWDMVHCATTLLSGVRFSLTVPIVLLHPALMCLAYLPAPRGISAMEVDQLVIELFCIFGCIVVSYRRELLSRNEFVATQNVLTDRIMQEDVYSQMLPKTVREEWEKNKRADEARIALAEVEAQAAAQSQTAHFRRMSRVSARDRARIAALGSSASMTGRAEAGIGVLKTPRVGEGSVASVSLVQSGKALPAISVDAEQRRRLQGEQPQAAGAMPAIPSDVPADARRSSLTVREIGSGDSFVVVDTSPKGTGTARLRAASRKSGSGVYPAAADSSSGPGQPARPGPKAVHFGKRNSVMQGRAGTIGAAGWSVGVMPDEQDARLSPLSASVMYGPSEEGPLSADSGGSFVVVDEAGPRGPAGSALLSTSAADFPPPLPAGSDALATAIAAPLLVAVLVSGRSSVTDMFTASMRRVSSSALPTGWGSVESPTAAAAMGSTAPPALNIPKRQASIVDMLTARTVLAEGELNTPRPASKLRASASAEPAPREWKAMAWVYPATTVMFVYVANMTQLSARATNPLDIITFLNKLYSDFDDVIAAHAPAYKVMAIGNMYLVVAGAPEQTDNHAVVLSRAALAIMKHIKRHAASMHVGSTRAVFKIGLHSGELAAGVIGVSSLNWHIFGDTVNVASRMCSVNEKGCIQLSPVTAEMLKRVGTPGRVATAAEMRVVPTLNDVTPALAGDILSLSIAVRPGLSVPMTLECRGRTEFKGKGDLTSWWLTDPELVALTRAEAAWVEEQGRLRKAADEAAAQETRLRSSWAARMAARRMNSPGGGLYSSIAQFRNGATPDSSTGMLPQGRSLFGSTLAPAAAAATPRTMRRTLTSVSLKPKRNSLAMSILPALLGTPGHSSATPAAAARPFTLPTVVTEAATPVTPAMPSTDLGRSIRSARRTDTPDRPASGASGAYRPDTASAAARRASLPTARPGSRADMFLLSQATTTLPRKAAPSALGGRSLRAVKSEGRILTMRGSFGGGDDLAIPGRGARPFVPRLKLFPSDGNDDSLLAQADSVRDTALTPHNGLSSSGSPSTSFVVSGVLLPASSSSSRPSSALAASGRLGRQPSGSRSASHSSRTIVPPASVASDLFSIAPAGDDTSAFGTRREEGVAVDSSLVEEEPMHPFLLTFENKEVEARYVASTAPLVQSQVVAVVFLFVAALTWELLREAFLIRDSDESTALHDARIAFACSGFVVGVVLYFFGDVIPSLVGIFGETRNERMCIIVALSLAILLDMDVDADDTEGDPSGPSAAWSSDYNANTNFLLLLSFSFLPMRAYAVTGINAAGFAIYVACVLNATGSTPAWVLAAHFITAGASAIISSGISFVREKQRRDRFNVDSKAVLEAGECQDMLAKMLPSVSHAKRLVEGEDVVEELDDVTFMYSDIKGFTTMSSTMPAESLIEFLDSLFYLFDKWLPLYGVYKIETIGDAFIVVGGLTEAAAVTTSARSDAQTLANWVPQSSRRVGGGSNKVAPEPMPPVAPVMSPVNPAAARQKHRVSASSMLQWIPTRRASTASHATLDSVGDDSLVIGEHAEPAVVGHSAQAQTSSSMSSIPTPVGEGGRGSIVSDTASRPGLGAVDLPIVLDSGMPPAGPAGAKQRVVAAPAARVVYSELPPDALPVTPVEERAPLSHAGRVALYSLRLLELVRQQAYDTGVPIEMRVGIHTGRAVGGIIGRTRPRYFVWGSDCNTAEKMESSGEPMQVHVSLAAALRLASEGFVLVPHKVVAVGGEEASEDEGDAPAAKGTPVPHLSQDVQTFLLIGYDRVRFQGSEHSVDLRNIARQMPVAAVTARPSPKRDSGGSMGSAEGGAPPASLFARAAA